MNVWRLADDRFARDLSGTGSRLNGGRWNSAGSSVLYTSEHLSTAVLETLVHAPIALAAGLQGRMAVKIALPVNMDVKEVPGFPVGLKGADLLSWCRREGDKWISEAKCLLLRAPSVIVPEDFNIIVNCAHPQFQRVKIGSLRPFVFDGRLFR
jgi:RES domain-containing protein